MGLPVTGQTNWGIPLNAYITGTVLATANSALSAVSAHTSASDPHGDRAYANGLVSPLTSGVNGPNGFAKLNGSGLLPVNLLPVGSVKTTFWDAQRDGGATGNGTTDDTAAIQLVLSNAASAGGGEVWVPAGTYKITKQLIIGSNTWLHLSPGATMKRGTPVAGAAPSIMIATVNFAATPAATPSASNILISGGAWDATGGQTLTSACTPIMIIGGFFASVSQTGFVQVAGNPGIELNGVQDVVIRDCQFSGNQVTSPSTVPAVRLNSTSTSTTPSGLASGAYGNQICANVLVESCSIVPSSYSQYPPVGRLVGTDLYAGFAHGAVTVTACSVASNANLTYPMVDMTHITGGQAFGNQFGATEVHDITTSGAVFIGPSVNGAAGPNVDVAGQINWANGVPGNYTRETWHDAAYKNGWSTDSAGTKLQSKRFADGLVCVSGVVDSSSGTGAIKIAQLYAAHAPLFRNEYFNTLDVTTNNGVDGWVDTSGNVFVNVGSVGSGNPFVFSFIYPIDAPAHT